MRYLAILAALGLAGCSIGPQMLGASSYKGQPLSAVVTKLGPPQEQETAAGQKAYTWREGSSLLQCTIRVTMAGDVIASYETSGDANICSSYDG